MKAMTLTKKYEVVSSFVSLIFCKKNNIKNTIFFYTVILYLTRFCDIKSVMLRLIYLQFLEFFSYLVN